jgi:hypothetical protein
MAKLLAAGCSFIFGNELADQSKAEASNSTFPALLAHDLGLNYQCVAVPGSGSDSHVRQVIEHFDQDTELVVVAWSYAGRFEFNFDEVGWQEILHVSYKPPHLKKIIEPFSRQFYSQLTGHYKWYHYVKDILFLQQWLTAKGVPYLFCGMDPDFDKKAIKDSMFQTLCADINFDNWFFWKIGKQKNFGFRKWTLEMQKTDARYAIGMQDHHPLEHAHRESFNLIKAQLTHKGLYDTYRTGNW